MNLEPKNINILDMKEIINEAHRQNVLNFGDEIDTSDKQLMKKVHKFAEKYGIESSPEMVKAFIKEHCLGLVLGISASKQNLPERMAYEYLNELDHVSIKNLNNRELLMLEGKPVKYSKMDTNTEYKSLDFIISYGTMLYLTTHKYAAEGGGSQDSHFMEILRFIKECKRYSYDCIGYIILVHGDYYTKMEYKQGFGNDIVIYENKLCFMQLATQNHPNIIVSTPERLVNELRIKNPL
jgi:hypothetical protein